ncbi:hypothetical protein SSABA_v1c03850 [Spiroplasma sabaudiense Ar-1343]|uniref:Uncharacterized protein n=1 Tax=Spiroplasma sabaudiense Ar-1343 TaxID=1276257 RepID=W6AJ99_9MOLU|nr:hypothetical protein [Spiroplasma sabaudiense]AHI53794.1 hypothetical protein SSABA_v1c03850 [Spiroplasma sabaudiense Ar-1343]
MERIKELNPNIDYSRIDLSLRPNVATLWQLPGGSAYKISSNAKLYYNSKLSFGGIDEPNFKCNFNKFQSKSSFIVNILDETYDPETDGKISYNIERYVDIKYVVDKNNDFIIVTVKNTNADIGYEFYEKNTIIYWHDVLLVSIDMTFN